MYAGERGHGAAGPKQSDVLALLGQHGREIGECAPGALAHAHIGLQAVLAFQRFLALALGERDDAPRRAPPGPDSRRSLFLIDQHQFGRSAADVEDQRRTITGLEQFVAAEDGEPRLFGRLDDVEHDAGFVAHSVGELPSVLGAAASFGSDRARQRHIAPPQLVRTHSECLDRAIHGILREFPGAREALAKADNAGERVDDGEAAVARPRNQQAAIVGTEVDCAIGAAVRLPPMRETLVRRPALSFGLVPQGRRTGGFLRHDYARFCPSPPDASG